MLLLSTSTRSTINNSFENISHRRLSFISDFALTFDLWCEIASIIRFTYKFAFEILRLLKFVDSISELSKTLNALKNQCREQLSLLSLKINRIRIKRNQQSTMIKDRKRKQRFRKEIRKMFYFDLIALFSTMHASSSFLKKQYYDMTLIVNALSKLFHSNNWRSSIRSTFEEFAFYSNASSIFSFDILWFKCLVKCENVEHDINSRHMNRVIFMRKNQRCDSLFFDRKVLKIQEVIKRIELSNSQRKLLRVSSRASELFIFQNQCYEIYESETMLRMMHVILNWRYNENRSKIYESKKKRFDFFIRQMYNKVKDKWISLNLFASLRVDLELLTYEREYLIMTFVYRRNNMTKLATSKFTKCYSMSLMIFIDDFDLFRNAYRFLMSIYVILASMTLTKRNRRANVFSITLESHELELSNVINAISLSLTQLDREIFTQIEDDETILLCVYILTFINDLSQ